MLKSRNPNIPKLGKALAVFLSFLPWFRRWDSSNIVRSRLPRGQGRSLTSSLLLESMATALLPDMMPWFLDESARRQWGWRRDDTVRPDCWGA